MPYVRCFVNTSLHQGELFPLASNDRVIQRKHFDLARGHTLHQLQYDALIIWQQCSPD